MTSIRERIEKAAAFDKEITSFRSPRISKSATIRGGKKEHARLAPLISALAECAEASREATEYLNDTIACLPCESRHRDLPEDDWEHLMYLRDIIDEALSKLTKVLGDE